ncbi:FHA domain-containing protein [Elongatibacter sediminis]|uniref:FHA domain-containing protein n=1 Tax=Elongatibacter sediminis TaxID=3119006 RepID=A0AAW9RHB9_9GAMM
MHTYRLKGASGSVANEVFELRQRTVVGRADDCDLRLDDDGCAPRHCTIELRDDGVLELKHIAEEPGFGTVLNGQPVTSAALARGDEVRIGAARWVVQAPGLRPERVLTETAVRRRNSLTPWLVGLALAAAAALAVSWQQGWLAQIGLAG